MFFHMIGEWCINYKSYAAIRCQINRLQSNLFQFKNEREISRPRGMVKQRASTKWCSLTGATPRLDSVIMQTQTNKPITIIGWNDADIRGFNPIWFNWIIQHRNFSTWNGCIKSTKWCSLASAPPRLDSVIVRTQTNPTRELSRRLSGRNSKAIR